MFRPFVLLSRKMCLGNLPFDAFDARFFVSLKPPPKKRSFFVVGCFVNNCKTFMVTVDIVLGLWYIETIRRGVQWLIYLLRKVKMVLVAITLRWRRWSNI